MKFSSKHLGTSLLLTALLAGPTALHAADQKNADPTGTWKWTRQGRNGNEVTSTLTLKADGDKLTGKVSGWNNRENEIEHGMIKGDEISFDVSREFNGNEFVIKYSAKIEGDTMKGKTTFGRNGEDRSREWTAKRAGGDLAGDWAYTIEMQNGNSLDLVMSLKVDGQKVDGVVKINDREMPIEGTYKNGTFEYKTERERNGQKWTTHFTGKVSGDKLTGKTVSNWNGEDHEREITATRVKK